MENKPGIETVAERTLEETLEADALAMYSDAGMQPVERNTFGVIPNVDDDNSRVTQESQSKDNLSAELQYFNHTNAERDTID